MEDDPHPRQQARHSDSFWVVKRQRISQLTSEHESTEASREYETMSQRAASDILDESFLEVRAKLLEVSATLDRIDRSADDGDALADQAVSRRSKLDDAIRILLSEGPDRAERLQRLFSRQYEPQWRDQMQV